jgi:ABC-2 type transport system permease protein
VTIVIATTTSTEDLRNGPSQSRQLAGFAHLFWFMVRRDRMRAPVWIVAIVGLVAISTASVVGLYQTPAELGEYAALAQADPALKAFAGPGYGLDDPTLGAVVMNEVQIYTLIVVALMCVFLLIRHTRAEEETDRAELVRAAGVGRLAILAAASVWVAVINLVVAVGVTVGVLAFGVSTTGTLAYGAVTWAIGMVFIGIAAAAAQIASGARAATAGSGVALGVFFLLRAVGDLGTGWMTWLSPLGWAQSIRAFDDERWWVLVPLVITAGGLTAGAIVLSARRDLGAGFFQQRPGPAEGSPRLGTPLAMATRLQRTSLISWTLGLAALGFFFGIVADQADKMLESEAVAEFFAQFGVGSPTEVFLATTVLMVALTASGYTVSTVLRLRTEEFAVRAEPVLATPVSRGRWVLSYLTVAVGGTIVAMLVTGLAIGLGAAAQLGDAGQIPPVLAAVLVMVPAQMVLAAMTVLLVGWRPQWAPLAWLGVAVSTVVGLLAETLKLPNWIRTISPYHHVPALPAASFELLPVVMLVVVAVGLTIAGLIGISRRDIG